MTACSNKRGRAGRVITAALVGALSVGAPAVALAANGGVDLLVNDAAGSFSNGKITKANTPDGASQIVTDNKVTTPYTGSKIEVVPTEVTTAADAVVSDVSTSGDYRISYVKADSKGEPTDEAVSSIVDPGKYCVKVEAVAGDYAGGVAYLKVTVSGKSLSGVSAYEVDPSDDSDLNDTDFTYTGSELAVGFKDSTVALVEGEDYDVEWQTASGASDAPVAAGTYYAVLTGKGLYEGSEKTVTVNVGTFDLNSATVSFDPVVGTNALPKPASVKLSDGTSLDPSLVKVEITAYSNGAGDSKLEGFTKPGKYTVTVSKADADNANIENDKSGQTIKKYSETAAVLYDGEAMPSSFSTDLNDKKPSYFDVTLLSGSYGDDETEIDKSKVQVTVTDENGTEVAKYNDCSDATADSGSSDWYKTKGVYTVKVAVASDYAAAGVATCKVTVAGETVDADADVYVTYMGKEITSLTADWSQAGISISDFDAKGSDSKGNDISAKLDVKVTDANGKEVTGTIEDAGEYTLTVSSDDYALAGTTTLKVTINKLNLSDLTLSGTNVKEKFGYVYLNTSSASTTVSSDVKAQYLEGVDADGNGKLDRVDVPTSSDVKVSYQKLNEETGVWADVTTIAQNATGTYRVVVSPLNDSALDNFVFASEQGTVVEFSAVDGDVKFADVLPSDWWFEPVTAVTGAKYMNGYAGTQFFGSEDTITRAQVACVLYNMAVNYDQTNGSSEDLVDETKLEFDAHTGYATGFDDVDGTMYYAKAIAWAEQVGVVNGNDGLFRPEEAVTREEFAAMVANFAKKVNDFEAPAADALDGFADADQVSGWAEEVVAWAVENGIMGNGGAISPSADITRAEAAAMVYNYAEL